jgi:hypothetical protein
VNAKMRGMKLQPTPVQAIALADAGLIRVDDFPDIAAQWLADGMDSDSLRILAGADHEDAADKRDLWTATLQELQIQTDPPGSPWPLIWAYELASFKAGDRTSGKVLQDAVDYLRGCNYDDDAADEASILWQLWDEIVSTYDPPRTQTVIWADIDSYIRSF